MAKDTGLRTEQASSTQGQGESQYSHFELGSTHGRWERGAASDFAITSVNVPDRLDTQEVRARADADYERPTVQRFHRSDIIRGVRWLLVAAVAIAVVWGAVRTLGPLRAAVSPTGIAAMVSAALGAPVHVSSSEFRFLPTPRLVITDLVSQSGFRLPELAFHFNWRDAFRGLQSSRWVVGEVRVAAMELSGPQAMALLHSVRGADRLPAAISTIRFESLALPDLPWLPGRHEAVIRRDAGTGQFGAIHMARLGVDGLQELEITPPLSAEGNARFVLFASKWTAPAGPAVAWSEAAVQGEFRADLLKVDSYSVAAPFGSFSGSASLVKDGQTWRLAGNLRAADLSIEELIRHAATLGDGDAVLARVPLRGHAKFDLTVVGGGATAAEALARSTASGAVVVQGATFIGLNLGVAATTGGVDGAGGVTRLSDLDLDVVAGSDGLTIRNVAGRAGSLRVSGGARIDRRLQLSGHLRPEVTSPRVVASAQIRLGGTAAAPTFQ